MPSCQACGHANPEGAKFCNDCGARLDVPPPAARDVLSYTPRHLVERILATRAQMQGERKEVTVLFADVKGSMDLAESVDPEEWHRIMDRFFSILTEGVHRFEGTINQYGGDGIMALFGAPLAHEDHAQRACHTALYLRDALSAYAQELRRRRGLDLAVRIGLNSGAVVIGTIGDDLRMDYTAQGHTVGLAARMEQIAEAGRVYLSEGTAALVAGYFRLEDLGAFDVKGVREPLRVYALQGPGALRTRLDASRARGLSRFVGRMSEMKRLESALARARSGQAAVVALIAEAGAGKSRLAAEFADTCRRGGLAVFEAHAPAHGRRIPNLAAADFYRSLFGIAAADSARAAREKIAGRLVLLDETMREHLPLVFELLGVGEADAEPTPKDAEVREQRLLGVARRVLDDASRSEPAVVLWEDLHWLDEASESFLRAFVESARAARTLVILTFRPEYPAGWLEECGAEILRLAPLGDSAVGELLGDLLGGPAASAGLIQRVRERTGGNPFFIEEVVQSLFERGVLDRANGEVRVKLPVAEVDIPSSVRAVLAARIDRLPENRRRVLQTAAVIGKRFARSVLREVLPAPESDLQPILDDLVAAEFLFAGGTESDPEYVFKHPLTQEVADQSQLVEHRTRVHAAVAGAMQSIYAERADEHAALIAYHWEGAAEPLAAAAWLQRAAETAGVMGPRAELPHWRHIRELLADRDDREALRTRVLAIARMIILGTRIAEATEDVASLLAEGQEIAERLGEDAPKGGLLAARAIFYGVRGERDEALRAIGEALRIADADDTPLFTAEVAAMAVNVYDWFGFYREMQNVSERALARLETGEPGTASSLYPYLLVAKGLALSMSGRLAEGAHVLERALELARKSRDPETIGRAHLELAFNALDACDPPTALRHVTAAREIGERLGSGSVYGPAFVALGATLAASERWEEAVATLSAVREVLRQARSGRTFEGIILSYLAQAHLGHGDQAAALDIAEEAVRCTQRDGVIGYELRAQLDLAQTLRACAGAAAADRIGAAIDRAAALMAESGAFVHRAAIEVERAELARLLGDDAAYESGLRSARRLFTEMGAFGHAARLAERLGDSA